MVFSPQPCSSRHLLSMCSVLAQLFCRSMKPSTTMSYSLFIVIVCFELSGLARASVNNCGYRCRDGCCGAHCGKGGLRRVRRGTRTARRRFLAKRSPCRAASRRKTRTVKPSRWATVTRDFLRKLPIRHRRQRGCFSFDFASRSGVCRVSQLKLP